MAREIPEVVRAAAGLAATVLDEARKLPETLPGLPVRLIGMAMQHAMKVQQHYAGLVARGDELFTGLRGEDEPGLATFDDDDHEPAPASGGFRESAFDRAGDAGATGAEVDLILDEEVADAEGAPDTQEVLDEIAIDELVDQAPTLEETAPGTPAPAKKAAKKAAAKQTAGKQPAAKSPAKKSQAAKKAASPAAASPATADTLDAEPTADVATTVDVLTPAGDVATVEATVTDEGVAAPEGEGTTAGTATPDTATPDTATPDTATTDTATPDTASAATATDEGDSPVAAAPAPSSDTAADAGTASDTPTATGTDASTNGSTGGTPADSSTAPRTPPVDGYDAFTVAQLRGRLRGYALSTVQDLVAYEEATRARAPYLTMLRNRLEKLEEQAIESSPLAPRGA